MLRLCASDTLAQNPLLAAGNRHVTVSKSSFLNTVTSSFLIDLAYNALRNLSTDLSGNISAASKPDMFSFISKSKMTTFLR